MRQPREAPDTRTRILEAAIERFGRDGFGATLRTIAADAGVSAPTIIKYFGSKEELHATCDEHVLAVTASHKTDALRSADLPGAVVAQLAVLDEFQPLVRYLVRSVMAGGDVARNLIEQTRAHALAWMREGVRAGHVRPSRDEEARVKLVLSVTLGWMVQSVLTADEDLSDLDTGFWRREMHDVMLTALEVSSKGLLTDRALLDEYLLYMSEPP